MDLQRAAVYDHYAQIFALFCGSKPVASPEDAHKRFTHLLQTAQQAFASCGDELIFCATAEQWKEAQQQQKTAAFLSIEGAELLQSEEDIQTALDAGIRIVTLTWNHDSVYGCGAVTDQQSGLTSAGKHLAQYLSTHQMYLDVSHLSERGFWELADCVQAPLLATHSNSRSICNHPRNLTDAQFCELVRRGGLVGINGYVPFLTGRKMASCDDMVRHIEHFCELGGEKHIALGTDWDGCDRLPKEISDVADMEHLAEALVRHHYSDQQIADIFYDNASAFVAQYF